MGGMSVWSGISTVDSKWELTSRSGYTGSEQSEEDWSRGYVEFRNSTTDSQGVHTISSNTEHQVIATEPNRTRQLPRKLQDLALPLEFPAATFLFELKSPAYDFQYIGVSGSTVRLSIVKLVRPGTADEFTREIWSFSQSSGLPTRLSYFTKALDYHRPVPESMEFSNYKRYGSVIVPSIVRTDIHSDPLSAGLLSLCEIAKAIGEPRQCEPEFQYSYYS